MKVRVRVSPPRAPRTPPQQRQRRLPHSRGVQSATARLVRVRVEVGVRVGVRVRVRVRDGYLA